MAVILRTAGVLTGAAFPEPGFTSVWWLPGTAGGSVADATDCLARFKTFWDTIKASLQTSVTVDFDPVCIAVEATTGVLTGAFTGTDPASVTGTGAVDSLPRQTQGLIRLQTSTIVNGRRLRGRIFVPCPIETDNGTNGGPSTTYQNLLVTGAASMLLAGATASTLQIWHRPTNGAGGASASVTGVSSSPSWAVLRSRR